MGPVVGRCVQQPGLGHAGQMDGVGEVGGSAGTVADLGPRLDSSSPDHYRRVGFISAATQVWYW